MIGLLLLKHIYHLFMREIFILPRSRAEQVRTQRQHERGWKLFSLHAPEVECIGKGNAHKPYELGVKLSIATTNARLPGGQFVVHAKALPGKPYDCLTSAFMGSCRSTDSLTESALALSSHTDPMDIRLHLRLPVRIKRRGVELRLFLHGCGRSDRARHDATLINALARAIGWLDDLANGRVASIGEIAASHQVGRRYVAQQLRLAFLAPDFVKSILAGTQPADLTAETLVRHVYLPVDWDEQRALLVVR